MKTTVEMPADLMVELKVIAAREHRRLREVMEEVVRLGLRARHQRHATADEARDIADAWLRDWQALGAQVEAAAKDPRSCVDILLSDRR